MKIVFFGTPAFSIPSLTSIIDSNHELLLVVTNPDKKSGRGLNKSSSPIKQFCDTKNIDYISFDDLENENTYNYLNKLNADLFVVVAFKILPDKIINMPGFGSINLHPSILPKYRGSSPIQQAILNGDSKTGVTIFKLNTKVDSGDIIIQEEYDINNDITFSDLYSKLGVFGSKILLKAIDLIRNDNMRLLRQKKNDISYAYKIKPNDCKIDWNDSAKNINNKIRAFTYTPGAFTFLNSKKVKLFNSSIALDYSSHLKESACIYINEKLLIGTNDNPVAVRNVQIAGKKIITAKDFYNSAFSHNNKIINFE